MIYDKKEIRKIIDAYSKKNPKEAFHMKSKLNCWRFEQQLRFCAKIIPKNASVLDIGCGWGHTCIVLKTMRPDLSITGIDSKKRAVWSKLKKFKVKIQKGDALKTKFKNSSFDAVLSFGLMEHVKNDDAFLKETYRILKLNGIKIMFNLPNRYSMNEALAKMLNIWHHERKYTKREIKELFEKNKFRNIKTKRELLLPAQVNRVSRILAYIFDKSYRVIDFIDRVLVITPLNMFAQSYRIYCVK